MKSKHSIFFVSLLCVVALATALTFALKQFIPQIITSLWPFIILFFTLENVIIYFMTIKVRSKNDIHKMTNFHMLTTITRLIVCLAIIAIYAIMIPASAKAFVVSFLVYYLCFTVFETFVKIKINN